MVNRKKPKAAGDQLSEFVVVVASGDMPTETVNRADNGKNSAADALRRMGKIKGKKGSPGQRSGRPRAVPEGGRSRRAGT